MVDERRELDKWKLRTYQLVSFALFLFIANSLINAADKISDVVITFFIAVLINYLLAKPVDFLTKYIRYRIISVAIIYLTFISLLILISVYLFPEIFSQLKLLSNTIPSLVPKLKYSLDSFTAFLAGHQIILPFSFDLNGFVNGALEAIKDFKISQFSSILTSFIKNSVSAGLYIVLTIIISFYLLVDGKRVWELFLTPFDGKVRDHLVNVKSKIDKGLYAFIIGQFQVASMTTLVMLSSYFILKVPFALVLGLAQMLEMLPVIGTWMAIIPCLIIVGFSTSFTKAFIAFIVYMAYTQIFRDNFITPRIMGDALGFHPIAIILGLIIGAKLYGAFGVIFALPIMAVISGVIQYMHEISRLKVRKF